MGARQVVIRYEVREPKAGCCQCSDMNQSGLIALVALIFVCWPLACIPCCMKSCHESYQVPVSGPPAYQPPVCPFVAPPAQGIPTTGKVPADEDEGDERDEARLIRVRALAAPRPPM